MPTVLSLLYYTCIKLPFLKKKKKSRLRLPYVYPSVYVNYKNRQNAISPLVPLFWHYRLPLCVGAIENQRVEVEIASVCE